MHGTALVLSQLAEVIGPAIEPAHRNDPPPMKRTAEGVKKATERTRLARRVQGEHLKKPAKKKLGSSLV